MSTPLQTPLAPLLRSTATAGTRQPAPDRETLRARVVQLVPAYRQALLETAEGRGLAVTVRTEGVALADLRVGQWLDCVVTTDQPRVLQARLVG